MIVVAVVAVRPGQAKLDQAKPSVVCRSLCRRAADTTGLPRAVGHGVDVECGRVDERTDEQSTGGLCGCVDAQIHAKVGHCAHCLGCIRLTKHDRAGRQGRAEHSRAEKSRAEQDKGAKCDNWNCFSLPGCR